MLNLLMLKLGTVTGLILGWVALNSPSEPGRPVLTKKVVHNFAVSCEHLLAALLRREPLTDEESKLIEYYCTEMRHILHQRDSASVPEEKPSSTLPKVNV